MNTRRLTSKREASHRHRALAPSSRSEAIFDFFERPPSRKPSYVTAHRGLGDLHTRLIQKSLAMLPESKIGVGVQLRGQPLPQRLALHRWSAGDLVDVDFPCLASSVEPALDGRTGDPEEV